ncbi:MULTISPECIES: GTP-binding protein [Clostridium]|uniref:Ni2+-binding GTPase involved in regulation of expression and maturation of urease and hydrogenase n=1 Tax=Clostridium cadaveris TaxID=1529 RepID=A0A1I2K9G8_9CLOT|nr:GTP-binding protein [Clostridium cadaveris]MDU4950915.1 GTP-binding protein [Clostridium sp.]MDM8310844.1 GTP-binding protein [Clostridium cadaveris]MDY4949139.1 GTP-binding protein [Clostridium cadaveris]NME63336.1 cobalamin biosynthesis protein P47K [Clostridium cadaveris]SFF61576.1 Ni2+-binding GTPase involved in regulation of expression and maturation of urease and hydrogenase [Clostridium cadaveris]
MKTILISGSSSVGKTALIKHLIPHLKSKNLNTSICKIDCLATDDDLVYRNLDVPYMVGLSKDICPDHFLISNLNELMIWANNKKSDVLIIETAGLCNRCSPATNRTLHICVCDCTSSFKTPQKLGPMLSESDAIVLSKIDMVSQAEREIISFNIRKINPNSNIFFIDGLVGFGVELVSNYLINTKLEDNREHLLRHTMPSGVCSYCIGECRIGEEFQQGIVSKINFRGEF